MYVSVWSTYSTTTGVTFQMCHSRGTAYIKIIKYNIMHNVIAE